MSPTFFATAAHFRDWLAAHAGSARELLVGFHKVDSGRPSMSWSESVDDALCVGWIDGVRKRVDDFSYTIRFTPRKTTSHWSGVNIDKIAVLMAQGRMQPAGITAFAARLEHKSRTASYEQKSCAFDGTTEKTFRRHRAAWKFFQAQPPGYRKLATWRVISAKQEKTRATRLEKLIAASAAGRRLL